VVVDLARQKVFANKFEPYEAPIYFKSHFLPPEDTTRGNKSNLKRC
jgi:hypothetical protein